MINTCYQGHCQPYRILCQLGRYIVGSGYIIEICGQEVETQRNIQYLNFSDFSKVMDYPDCSILCVNHSSVHISDKIDTDHLVKIAPGEKKLGLCTMMSKS